VTHAFREIERFLKDSGENVDRDLHPDSLERSWNQLMMVYEERDHIIHEEIARLEKLQRLAEKVHQEAKVTDSKLDDIEAWIEDEAKRVDHLHPKDAKNNCDHLRIVELTIIKLKMLYAIKVSSSSTNHITYSV